MRLADPPVCVERPRVRVTVRVWCAGRAGIRDAPAHPIHR
jgi:hypothetical protein